MSNSSNSRSISSTVACKPTSPTDCLNSDRSIEPLPSLSNERIMSTDRTDLSESNFPNRTSIGCAAFIWPISVSAMDCASAAVSNCCSSTARRRNMAAELTIFDFPSSSASALSTNFWRHGFKSFILTTPDLFGSNVSKRASTSLLSASSPNLRTYVLNAAFGTPWSDCFCCSDHVRITSPSPTLAIRAPKRISIGNPRPNFARRTSSSSASTTAS
mmetsp:Transcript_57632/g.158285  ORF Transcript_57632/g.158285 Transcript_57632/m.158285 type:complete len:216 (-) Transcript_57632:182-829(-)